MFFSLSTGKRGLYLLPAFPAAALLCSQGLLHFLEGRTTLPRSFTATAAIFALILAGGTLVWLTAPLLPEGDVIPGLATASGLAMLAVLLVGVVCWVVLARREAPLMARLVCPVATVLAFELCVFTLFYPALDPTKSPRVIAVSAAEHTAPDEAVGLVSDRAMAGGLVYYAGRRVALLSTPESIERFFAEGGRTVVVKERKVDRVEAVQPVEVIAKHRGGRRAVLVVTAASEAPAGGLLDGEKEKDRPPDDELPAGDPPS